MGTRPGSAVASETLGKAPPNSESFYVASTDSPGPAVAGGERGAGALANDQTVPAAPAGDHAARTAPANDRAMRAAPAGNVYRNDLHAMGSDVDGKGANGVRPGTGQHPLIAEEADRADRLQPGTHRAQVTH